MSIVRLRQEKSRQALKKYILYAMLAEVFFIPLSPTLATAALLIGIVLTAWRFFLHRLLKFTPLPFDTPVVIFIVISAASVFVSPDKFFSFYNFYNLVGVYALTYFLIGQNVETAKELKITVLTLFAAFLLSVLYGYWQAVFGISASDIKWVDGEAFPELKRRIFSTWENPNIFAGFLDMCLALLLGIFAKSGFYKEKAVCVFLMLLGVGALALTYSRGAALSLFVVFMVYGFVKDKRILIATIVLGILAVAVNPIVLERISSALAAADTSSEMRLAIWEATVAMIEDHPILGIGWGAYFMIYPEYDFYLQGADVLIVHAHNIYLNYAAEIGLLGAGAFFWYFFGTMNLAFTAAFGEEKHEAPEYVPVESVDSKIIEKEPTEDTDIEAAEPVTVDETAEAVKIIEDDGAVETVEDGKDNEEGRDIKNDAETEKGENIAEEVEAVKETDVSEELQEAGEADKSEETEETEAIDVNDAAAEEEHDENDNADNEEKTDDSSAETVKNESQAESRETEEKVVEESALDANKENAENQEDTESEEKESLVEAKAVKESEEITEPKEVIRAEIVEESKIETKSFSFKEFLKEPFFEDNESLQKGVSLGIGLAFVTVALNGLTDDLLFNIPTSMFLWMLAALAAKNASIMEAKDKSVS